MSVIGPVQSRYREAVQWAEVDETLNFTVLQF